MNSMLKALFNQKNDLEAEAYKLSHLIYELKTKLSRRNKQIKLMRQKIKALEFAIEKDRYKPKTATK